MRIIDKNTDFYDFYQNVYKDDTLTFDRRDSYILTKEIMCSHLYVPYYWSVRHRRKMPRGYNFILLQVCNTFWLFLVKLIKTNYFHQVEDYEIELLSTWRNFDKPRKLCSTNIISFYYPLSIDDKEKIYERLDDYIRAIDTNDFIIKKNINNHIIYNGNEKIEKHIPILKACGIANCVDAHNIYLAFEEYFSLEKTASERRDPVGTTDLDKVESHGFDKKISFRGK